jgi:hypothetical protein
MADRSARRGDGHIDSSSPICYYHYRETGHNGMQIIPQAYQVLYSELAQRAIDAQFSADFAIEGRFISMESRGRRYWYFDMTAADGAKKRRYVGPVDDPEITARVEAFKDLKADYRARRKIVSTLIREAYMPRPDPISGDIIRALADAGFFRLRGVLVGTVAFQCYAALLGVRLPNAVLQTGDADFAQFHSISVAVEDSVPDMLGVLRDVDPTFRVVPHQADSVKSTKFANRSGYKVEFLTPNTGSEDLAGKPVAMPALGGASAEPLRFLDFLIYQPVRAVLLHGAGVPVLVPAPERYAIHKLIVASRRRHDDDGSAKSGKDIRQAATLMDALIETRQTEALADAYMEAWDRGAAWREAMQEGLNSMEPSRRGAVVSVLRTAVGQHGADAGEYGF